MGMREEERRRDRETNRQTETKMHILCLCDVFDRYIGDMCVL